jgi:hypothetical protein
MDLSEIYLIPVNDGFESKQQLITFVYYVYALVLFIEYHITVLVTF